MATTRGIFGTTLETSPTKNSKTREPKKIFLPKIIARNPDKLLTTPVFSKPPIRTKIDIKNNRVLQSTSRRILCTVSIFDCWAKSRAKAAPIRATAAGARGTGKDSPTTNKNKTKKTIIPPRAKTRG